MMGKEWKGRGVNEEGEFRGREWKEGRSELSEVEHRERW